MFAAIPGTVTSWFERRVFCWDGGVGNTNRIRYAPYLRKSAGLSGIQVGTEGTCGPGPAYKGSAGGIPRAAVGKGHGVAPRSHHFEVVAAGLV